MEEGNELLKGGALAAGELERGTHSVEELGGIEALGERDEGDELKSGSEPVRELSAAMAALDANQGVYIAVNALSDAARTFASKNSIRVMQGTELALLMKHAALPKCKASLA